MKKLVFLFLIVQIISSCNSEKQKDTFKIAIVSIVEIDPIVQLRQGFKEVMDSSKFAEDHKIKYSEFNAQNDASIQNQIIDKLVTDKPDLIYVLGTPIAQAIQKRIPDVLLLQGASTDPVAADLANSWEGSGKNYIATTDLPPIKKQVELIKTLTPNTKNLGVIYNPGETNSVAVINRLRDYLKTNNMNIKLVERSISNTSEVSTAVQSLIGNVDAIYLPPDNTAHAAIPVIGKFCNEHQIPLYATVVSAIDDGALATLSLDFKTLGEESAKLALEVINGANPKELPIKPNENPQISINKKLIKQFDIDTLQLKSMTNIKYVN